MSLGLALSGGGVKGIAHLGVLKYFEERKINIEYISGCSSGSIVATLYAIGYSSEEIYELCNKYVKQFIKGMFRYNVFNIGSIKKSMGLNNGNMIESVIKNVCNQKGVNDIRDIKIPIFIPTVDLPTGRIIYYTNVNKTYIDRYDNTYTYIYGGDISQIIRASCSYPGLFSPKRIDEYLLVDGGLRDNVPIYPLTTTNANNILAVTFNSNDGRNIDNIFNVIFQSFEILVHDNNFEATKEADYVLEINLNNVQLLDISKMQYIYEQGYLQAKKYFEYN